jgi:phenylpropionate dioxygenase-like ring-hydroxylating dioxygenase large terminal subunit
MGNLMRRFWQPVGLSEELKDDIPLSVRLLGEDLALFRDEQGRVGLLGLRCSHRGVDLSYGRVEDGGLRCIYHGWLYDVHGNCLEQPGEPKGSDFHNKVRHPAYPCQELGGIIFTYMGPGDPPLFPKYEAMIAPETQRFVTKVFSDSSYLNSLEGNLDPVHVSFLHKQIREDEEIVRLRRYAIKGTESTINQAWQTDVSPSIEPWRTEFGIRQVALRQLGPDKTYLRISSWILPNIITAPGSTASDGYSLAWHVPIDDTHSWRYSVQYRRSGPLDREGLAKLYKAEVGPDYKPLRNRTNCYLQDREQMKKEWAAGFGPSIIIQDVAVTDLQGEIQDRTQEQLGYTDKMLTAARRMMLTALRELEAGREPPHVLRSGSGQFPHPVVVSEVFPSSEDWKTYAERKIEEMEAISAKALV